MHSYIKTILVILAILKVVIEISFAQDYIGDNRHSIEGKLIKSTYKITKNTNEKIFAEFPYPKMYMEFYFHNNICLRYEGLIPLSEKEFYITSIINNGWVKFSDIEERTVIYKRGKFVLKIISLLVDVGYFKFKVDKN